MGVACVGSLGNSGLNRVTTHRVVPSPRTGPADAAPQDAAAFPTRDALIHRMCAQQRLTGYGRGQSAMAAISPTSRHSGVIPFMGRAHW